MLSFLALEIKYITLIILQAVHLCVSRCSQNVRTHYLRYDFVLFHISEKERSRTLGLRLGNLGSMHSPSLATSARVFAPLFRRHLPRQGHGESEAGA